jgi:RND family efflux transporter MFP subunit
MKKSSISVVLAIVASAVIAISMLSSANGDGGGPTVAANSALTVKLTSPQPSSLPIRVWATGNIVAWEEASIGAETEGLRLLEVKVNVGDVVKRGRVLAVFAAETVVADVAEAEAVAEEAAAALTEAEANARRARVLDATGAMSAEQINRYVTAERAARARLEAAKAIGRRQRVRLTQTQVRAPDDGFISSRTATAGAVVPSGQELFRLIRKGRLEWRAEVATAELAMLSPGQLAHVSTTPDRLVEGKLRVLSPAIDMQTRNGMVYVDLPNLMGSGQLRAGMFARGYFDIGEESALTLPQTAVLLRDGFSYVLRIGPESKVIETKVTVGRRVGNRIEITGGLDASERVVESGGSFIGDGDVVRVVEG